MASITTDEKVAAVHMDEPDDLKKADAPVVLRTRADDLSVWNALFLYKRIVAILVLAGFCASLDGYQSRYP